MGELLVIAALSLLLVLASFACLVWSLLWGQILGLDDLLLRLICLAVGAIFALNLVWMWMKTPLPESVRGTLAGLVKFRPRLPRQARPAEVSDSDHPNPSTP